MEVEEEAQKPVSEARELFEPSRAPGTRLAPKRPPEPAPVPIVSKKEKPMEQPKLKKYTEEVQMQIDQRKPHPEFQKRIPLYGIPVEEPETKPEKKPPTEARIPKFGIPVEEPTPVAPVAKQPKEKPRITKVRSKSIHCHVLLTLSKTSPGF